jgi:hypothetical protein
MATENEASNLTGLDTLKRAMINALEMRYKFFYLSLAATALACSANASRAHARIRV